jgi:Spy/CpxP family protein refolding chaperone
MKPLPRISLLVACVVVPAAMAVAQDSKPTTEPQHSDVRQPPADQPGDGRGNMLRQLGLSREQIQQIRRLNVDRRPLMEEAQRRFREANRSLDAAIYADEVIDADVQARLKDVQLAQAELQRLRFMNELAVRRILTPEQLVRFREMRRRFEEAREDFQQRRPFSRDRQIGRPPNSGPGGQEPLRPITRPAEQQPD